MKQTMRAGDLVSYQWPAFLGEMNKEFDRGIGIVLEVRTWQDPNSKRNVGIDIDVLWSDGSVSTCLDDELVWITGEN